MRLRLGYELIYDCPQPVPMLLVLNVHPSRAADLVVAEVMRVDPAVPVRTYFDQFGNMCSRIVAPAGRTVISAEGIIEDSGAIDPYVPDAIEHRVEDLPDAVLTFLLASRYCETELLSQTAWSMFGHLPPGWSRVQAVCDYAHRRILFDYQQARPTRTAWEAHAEQVGVCRDYTHLAVTLCRCLNIPARYCTGYLGDVGLEPPHGVPDFAAWFEAYLGGAWHTFDPRNNVRRASRILMARGRDATDVAIITTFGPNFLAGFKVVTDEIVETGRA